MGPRSGMKEIPFRAIFGGEQQRDERVNPTFRRSC